MPDGGAEFARIRLSGDRFTGGRLPVDALDEIQRYQALVLAAARRAWEEEHPGEEVPEGFDDSLKLVIARVEDGSAQVLLEREVDAPTDYDEAFEDAGAEVLRELEALLDADRPVSDAPLFQLKDFQAFGSSLDQGEMIQITSTERATQQRVEVSLSAEEVADNLSKRRNEYKRERRLERRKALHRDQRAIAGRLIALDADRRSFRLQSLHYGDIDGRYEDADLTAALKNVLNTSAKAPVVRLSADVQFRGKTPWRIKDVTDVEFLEVDGQPWSRKLIELASLGPDWDGEMPGAEMISFAALDAARDIVMRVVTADKIRPAIFPTEEGGVSLEWVSAGSVASIEIRPDAGRFEFHRLRQGEDVGTHSESSDILGAFAFAEEVGS